MNTDAEDFVGNAVLTFRFIVGALVLSVLLFAAIVAVFHMQRPPIAPGLNIVAYVGAAMLVPTIALQFLLLPILDAAARKRLAKQKDNTNTWIAAFGQRTIVGCALLEGTAFFCLVGSLIDGRPLGLAAGAVAAIAMIALHWPTRSRVQDYIDRQRERAANEGI